MTKFYKIGCLFVILALFSAICVFSIGNGAFAKAEDDGFFKEDEIEIVQITDTHYYPINYCHKNSEEFFKSATESTKLYLESSLINYKMLLNLIDQSPDYAFINGDLTVNGELQGHIEYSNLLRWAQNVIRANGKPDFQIFVVPGNHDLYNHDTIRYDKNANGEIAPNITRKQFTKLYAGLGYPNMTDEEMDEFYNTLSEVLTNDLPYTPDEGYRFINSQLSTSIEFVYQYSGKESEADYDNSDITYIAYCKDGYTFFFIDEEVSNAELGHMTGGNVYRQTFDFMNEQKASGRLDNTKTMMAILHHNVVPHFKYQDSLTKDFPLYNWKETADFFADFGIHYAFTGHTHANDISYYTSFNGNQIIDIESSSTTSYKGSMRIVKFERGIANGGYADNMKIKFRLVGETDFTKILEYVDVDYFEKLNVAQYIEFIDNKYVCTDVSEYAKTRFLLNLVDNMMDTYTSPEFILGISGMLRGFLNNISFLSGFSGFIDNIVENIIYHIENVVLIDYSYSGNNPLYMSNEAGHKIGGFLDDMLTRAKQITVNSRGDTFIDFGINAYLAHAGSLDTPLLETDPYIIEGLNNIKNGSVIQEVLDTLLYYNGGLTLIVEGVTKPMDLGRNMTDDEKESLAFVLDMIGGKQNMTDINAVVLDAYVSGVLTIMKTLFKIDFSLQNKTIWDFISGVLDSYITDSLYSGLGEIGGGILESFYIDETSDGSYDSYLAINPYNQQATFVKTNNVMEEASIENGKLPSMTAITFGEDPKTEKNFVWFTDIRVTDTVIEYCEGDFRIENVTRVNGDFEIYATTKAGIDLGIYSTLIEMEIGRHSIELIGLMPNTTYSYRLGSRENGWYGEVGTFKTAPSEDDPFEVLLFTDVQGFVNKTYQGTDRVLSNIDNVFSLGYDFVINCGDSVDNSANINHYDHYFNTLKSHWNNTTQVVAAGNHEEHIYTYQNNIESAWRLPSPNVNINPYSYFALHHNFAHPNQDTVAGKGVYYSFDYSGVHFTVLNTNDIVNNKLGEAQFEWLKNDLENTDKAHKVIIMHKGIYTAGSHNSEAEIKGLRSQLTSVFYDYGVHLVLQGHDHTYTESYYLDANGEKMDLGHEGNKKISNEGVLYVNLGTLGDKYYKYIENTDVPIEFGKDLHDPTLNNPTFGKLYFDGTDLYYTGYQYDLESDTFKEIRESDKDGLPSWAIALIATGGALVLAAGVGITIYLIKKKQKNAE